MSQEGQGLEPERLTWAVLLARWTDFARSAVALPQDGEAGMVRQSVTDIITLQAVWFALGHLDDLEGQERALGLDRSGVLISRHSAAIRTRYAGLQMPDELAELLMDVESVYQRCKSTQ